MFNSSAPFLRSAVPTDPLNLRLDFVKFRIYYQRRICIFVGKRRKFGCGHKLTRINRYNRFRMCPVIAVTTETYYAFVDQVLGRWRRLCVRSVADIRDILQSLCQDQVHGIS